MMQISAQSYEDRIDVASFGIIMWEMFTGKILLQTDKGMITEERLRVIVFDKRDELLAQISHLHSTIR